MVEGGLKNKAVGGAFWAFFEKASAQLVGFVVSMVLARLLTPEDYGTVALSTIFFAVSNAIVDGGFGSALVQKKDADDLDFNSVFYLSIVLSVLVYSILFACAPLIASFFGVAELVSIVRVSAICVVFNAVNSVQNAELTRKMLFHCSFRISIVTLGVSACVGVALAICGCGVWALVISTVISGLVGVIARWFIISWRPRLIFSFSRLCPLFTFGWKMAVSNIVATLFAHLNGLLIGRFYSRADLSFVNKGNSLPYIAMSQVDETLGRVSFPVLVELQNDRRRVREAMRKMIRMSSFLCLPIMIGLAICSKSIIRLLWGAQWLDAAPYMMLSCFSFALWPFHTVNLKGIVALGESSVFLKLEVLKKALALIVILCSFRLGVFPWMAISAFVLGPLSVIINAWPNRRLLDYTIGMQIGDVLPTVLVCVAEVVVVLGVDLVGKLLMPCLGIGDAGVRLMVFLACKLALQFVLGASVFFGLAYLFKLNPMGEYARVFAGVVKGRFPKVAVVIERRFMV